MTKLSRLLIAPLLIWCGGAVAAELPAAKDPAADVNLPVLLQTIQANRKALVSVNLNLSQQEGEKFWPIYDRYQKEIGATGARIAAVVEDYTAHFRELSDEKALQLVEEYLAVEAERLKIRQTYLPEFSKVLPGRTVARFYQIENKMDAVIRYELASTIPVIEEKKPAP